jgi:hypothetical protein
VEGVEEAHDVLTSGRVARELDRRLHGLGSGVREEAPHRPRHRRDAVEVLADLHVDREEEVARGVVDQLRGLLLDRLHDLRMTVPGGGDRDPRVQVQEAIAVDVLDHRAGGALRDERIRARERGARDLPVPLDQRERLRTGDVRDELRGLRLGEFLRRLRCRRHSSITVRDCSRMYWVT